MEFQIIFFTAVCLIATIVITTTIVVENRDSNGRIPLKWWIVSIGISQICIVETLVIWCKDWWLTHPWIMYVSSGITIAAIILGVITKIYESRH